jgi:hypothetical protein
MPRATGQAHRAQAGKCARALKEISTIDHVWLPVKITYALIKMNQAALQGKNGRLGTVANSHLVEH